MPRRNPDLDPTARLARRIHYLPGAFVRARARLARLEDEARRYGMTDLLQEKA